MTAQNQPDGPRDDGVEDAAQEVEEGALRLWESVLESLPRLGIALTFIAAGWLVGQGLRLLLERRWRTRRGPSFAEVMSRLASWVWMTLVMLVAVTLTFPSVKPVDLLAGFGFFSIALGFAFQDILENTLSGVLLLFRRPFRTGDLIEVDDFTGRVEAVTIRETRIMSLEGERIIIPNADVYKNAITVQAVGELRRDDFVVGVAYGSDLGRVVTIIVQALDRVGGVASEHRPEALVDQLNHSTVDVIARFWTDPTERHPLSVRSDAIATVLEALESDGIEMPASIVELAATPSFAGAVRPGVAPSPPNASTAQLDPDPDPDPDPDQGDHDDHHLRRAAR